MTSDDRTTELGNQLRALKGLSAEDDVARIEAARNFDEKAFEYAEGKCEVKPFMKAWAIARKLYCRLTGEPLI